MMLGNLGHSESYCVHDYLKLKGLIQISCKIGELSELKSLGLMPDAESEASEAFDPDFCAHSREY